jgi:hypothetical protein
MLFSITVATFVWLYCFWDAASIHILYISLVKLSINKMNESAGGEEDVAVPLLLKTLEDILYNIITQKKVETHKTQNRADTTDRVWRDIETLL